MEAAIADLVTRFERGGLTRRDLIQGLSLLAATAAAPVAAQTAGLQATGVDHTSVLVTDLQRSAEFYGRVFGLKPLSEDAPNRILRLGAGRVLVSLRQQDPPGLIDHFALTVDGFDRATVTETLKGHGLTPETNIEFGFHIKDPDGAVVQIV
jgi:catechol 2,3-dioxygenase-like lactoylglutathione lyase family enzyme